MHPATRPYHGAPVATTLVERLPRCCPVSGNPQPGSRVVIRYTAGAYVLDVLLLQRYLTTYIGGQLRDGRVAVRDMEAMIAQIAQDCAAAVGVPVTVTARLRINPRRQLLLLEATAP